MWLGPTKQSDLFQCIVTILLKNLFMASASESRYSHFYMSIA